MGPSPWVTKAGPPTHPSHTPKVLPPIPLPGGGGHRPAQAWCCTHYDCRGHPAPGRLVRVPEFLSQMGGAPSGLSPWMPPITLRQVIAVGVACDPGCCNQSGPQECAQHVGLWTLLSLVNGLSCFCCSHGGKFEAARREEGLHHVVTKE